MKDYVILKFGGTSVTGLSSWETIRGIVKERLKEGLRPVVVCSAMAGISDALTELTVLAVQGKHKDALKSIADKHLSLVRELKVDTKEIDAIIEDLKQILTGISLVREAGLRVTAEVLSKGEMMSTKLGAAYLAKSGMSVAWQDARALLKSQTNPRAATAQNFLSASCPDDPDPSLEKRLSSIKEDVILTQGFIASNSDGETVLLGRGGSDVSASYLATKLSARRCEIWTDVPGMYTANPRQVPSAQLLKTLSYEEAQEIASFGAKVLHPKCIPPVRKNGIPLHVKCLSHPNMEGTVISASTSDTRIGIKAISSRMGITLVSMETVDMWRQAGFLADAFECFKRHKISIDLVSTSESSVTVTLDQAEGNIDTATITSLVDDLSRISTVRVVNDCAFVSLIGKGIRAILHKIAPALEVFEEQKIYMVSQAANDLNLTFVVDEEQAERLVRELHGELFGQSTGGKHMGPAWQETFGTAKTGSAKPVQWWETRRDELIALAKDKGPLYVYNEGTIEKRLSELKSLKSADRIFYALKANSHPSILAKCHDAGLGFECVSTGEIEHVVKIFKGIDPKRILFTPNFAPREDYEYAFNLGAFVTFDNIYPFIAWPQIFKGREIFIRIDPGEGKGHHKYVHTAGVKSKFGVLPSQLDEVCKLTDKLGVCVRGLHAHVGSNIMAADTWGENAIFLAEIAERFPSVEFLDAGGGLGVPDRPSLSGIDLAVVGENLSKAKKARPKFELWLEPGRFVVAESGVLLARVTQTKVKDEYFYIGLNTGMNSLIRPALYGSYHEIVNLSRLNEAPSVTANIVGPICESGDILGYSRQMPETKDGDIILIATAGAYGRVMSSNYNMRTPAEEVFLLK